MGSKRGGYELTSYVIDVSPSLARTRSVDDLMIDPVTGEHVDGKREITNLDWMKEYVERKMQEKILRGLKTDKVNILLYGAKKTKNDVNKTSGGYEGIFELSRFQQADITTLDKLRTVKPTEKGQVDGGAQGGDALDALVVAITHISNELGPKKITETTWKRSIVLLTDGETPLIMDEWESISSKAAENHIGIRIIGVDFDDEELGVKEEGKSNTKRQNEDFFRQFVCAMPEDPPSVYATFSEAISIARLPQVKQVHGAKNNLVLCFGDPEKFPEASFETYVSMAKLTMLARPEQAKKVSALSSRGGRAAREKISYSQALRAAGTAALDGDDEPYEDEVEKEEPVLKAGAISSSQQDRLTGVVNRKVEHYWLDGTAAGPSLTQTRTQRTGSSPDSSPKKRPQEPKAEEHIVDEMNEKLEKAYKLGATLVPVDEELMPGLETRKGLEIVAFFHMAKFDRPLLMGDVSYVHADPGNSKAQVVLSSLIRALHRRHTIALARYVYKDGADPKIGMLYPVVEEEREMFYFAQVPFAEDVRRYDFPSLTRLVTTSGKELSEHRNLPTAEQQEKMDEFVDAMDLMQEGGSDDEGNRVPWFDKRDSLNPNIHRQKEGIFWRSAHPTGPIPKPHEELVKYFHPPASVLERSKPFREAAIQAFDIKKVPSRTPFNKKRGRVGEQEQPQTIDLDELLGKGWDEEGTDGAAFAAASPSEGQAKDWRDKDRDPVPAWSKPQPESELESSRDTQSPKKVKVEERPTTGTPLSDAQTRGAPPPSTSKFKAEDAESETDEEG